MSCVQTLSKGRSQERERLDFQSKENTLSISKKCSVGVKMKGRDPKRGGKGKEGEGGGASVCNVRSLCMGRVSVHRIGAHGKRGKMSFSYPGPSRGSSALPLSV